jgi:hypothetical protein
MGYKNVYKLNFRGEGIEGKEELEEELRKKKKRN